MKKLIYVLICLVCFGVGLILGPFLGPFFLWRGGLMPVKPTKVITQEGVTVSQEDRNGAGVGLTRNGEKELINAPEHRFWKGLIVAKTANLAYVIECEDLGRGGYNPLSVQCIHLPTRKKPLSSYRLEEVLGENFFTNNTCDAWISDLDDVSDDGSKLLIRLNMKDPDASQGNSTWYKQQSFFFYPKSKKLEPIKP